MTTGNRTGCYIPVCVPLTLLFAILKWTGALGWGWSYITLPLWGPWMVLIGLVVHTKMATLLFGIELEVKP